MKKQNFRRTKKTKNVFFFLILLSVCACSKSTKLTTSDIDATLDFSVKQSMLMYEQMKEYPSLLPRTFKDGELVTATDSWWTSGFYPGLLWYLYEYSQADSVKNAATEMLSRVENQQYTTNNHDVGFMINCSFGNAFRLTGEKQYESVIITAAKSLSTRYNATVGCIKSWDNPKWQYPVIVDNMMNLELLFNAAKLSGDSTFYKIAVSHADTTMKYHYRADGSSYHVVDYDTVHGGILERVTHQGAFDESAWARGQAWGLYGYVLMYRETKDTKYLNHAVKIANFIINHPNLPTDKIPYWDFNAPNIPDESRDASAGAIIASALIELSGYVDKQLSKKLLTVAETQLYSLSSSDYLAELGDNGNFILKNSVGSMPHNSEVDVPLTYADYYFIEALLRYKNRATISN